MLRRRQAEAREQMAEAYLELQGLTLRKRGDLDAVNPRPGDVPQCVFVRQNGRYTRFFRGDLPIGVRQQLVALPNEAAFQDAAIRQILDQDIPCTRVVHRRVYTFPADIGFARNNAIVRLKPKDKPLLAQLGFTAVEVQLRATFAVVHEGEAVSYCRATELSRALSDIAAECEVFAYPDYRRRGYARQVALAWAHYVQQRGTLLFFSHAADDEICASLAQSLRLIHVFDEVAYC